MDLTDILAFAQYRAGIYRLASSAFALEPTEEVLSQLIAAAQAAGEDDCMRACERELFAHLRGYAECDLAELRTRIATEYAELFVGPRAPLAPLYESIYLGFPNRLFTEQTRQVGVFYERCGVQVAKLNKVPDDHMAYELELMANLCEREAAAAEAGDEDEVVAVRRLEREFIVMHLGGWTKPFAERIEQAWCADYYAAWARFVEAFVAEDDTYLK